MAPVKRVRSNRVCFTLNNYTEEDRCAIEHHFENSTDIKYGICGLEIGESGTPHLQGYLRVDIPAKQGSLLYWRNRLPGGSRCHFESARGNDRASRDYCSKDGPYIEVGSPNASSTDTWRDIYEAAEAGGAANVKTIDAEAAVKYKFQLDAIYRETCQAFEAVLPDIELRDWQRDAMARLEVQDDRKVLVVVDEEGGKGKTTLADYIELRRGGWACGQGKHADLAHAWGKYGDRAACKFVAVDLTRCVNQDFYPWAFIEDLKNGKCFSGKYNSQKFRFPKQKVIVFMNQYPDKSKLSADRWDVLIL